MDSKQNTHHMQKSSYAQPFSPSSPDVNSELEKTKKIFSKTNELLKNADMDQVPEATKDLMKQFRDVHATYQNKFYQSIKKLLDNMIRNYPKDENKVKILSRILDSCSSPKSIQIFSAEWHENMCSLIRPISLIMCYSLTYTNMNRFLCNKWSIETLTNWIKRLDPLKEIDVKLVQKNYEHLILALKNNKFQIETQNVVKPERIIPNYIHHILLMLCNQINQNEINSILTLYKRCSENLVEYIDATIKIFKKTQFTQHIQDLKIAEKIDNQYQIIKPHIINQKCGDLAPPVKTAYTSFFNFIRLINDVNNCVTMLRIYDPEICEKNIKTTFEVIQKEPMKIISQFMSSESNESINIFMWYFNVISNPDIDISSEDTVLHYKQTYESTTGRFIDIITNYVKELTVVSQIMNKDLMTQEILKSYDQVLSPFFQEKTRTECDSDMVDGDLF